MINLYIDSNVWLSVYSFSKNDIDIFSKLETYLGKTIKLYLPNQTFDEVYRNRENKLAESMKQFKDCSSIVFPNFIKKYDEYKPFYKKLNDLKDEHALWLEKINNDIESFGLLADKCINKLFLKSERLDSELFVDLAEKRYKKGNPPGKDNKYGDAINWETLLANIPNNENLYFISDDKDYKSPLKDTRFNLFLAKEWKTKKNGKVIFYNDIASFLKDHVSELILKDENDKNELISKLLVSGSFDSTHKIILELSKFDSFSDNQIGNICFAAISNNQIGWIFTDQDINNFYKNVLGINDELILDLDNDIISEKVAKVV